MNLLKSLALFMALWTASISASPYTKIISLSPATTDIIDTLDLERYLVAVDTQSKAPTTAVIAYRENTRSPDRDRLEALGAQFITGIGVEDPFSGRYPDGLKGQFYPRPESYQELLTTIAAFSDNFGLGFLGREIALGMNTQLSKLLPINRAPRVLAILWDQPLRVASESSLIGDMIGIAGGRNIIESQEPYPEIEPQRLLGKEPDIVLIVNPKIRSRLMAGEIISMLSQHNDIWFISTIDPDLLLVPGPRIVGGIFELNKLFRHYNDEF